MKLTVFLVGLVGFPAIVWFAMPTAARRDRLLFASLILAAGFTLAGVVGFVLGEQGSVAKMTFGFLAIMYARARWQAALIAKSPALNSRGHR